MHSWVVTDFRLKPHLCLMCVASQLCRQVCAGWMHRYCPHAGWQGPLQQLLECVLQWLAWRRCWGCESLWEWSHEWPAHLAWSHVWPALILLPCMQQTI